MTIEQLNTLDLYVNTQLNILISVNSNYYNNVWDINFNQTVEETQNKIIWDLKNWFLHPTYTFNPITRRFSEENLEIREEISTEVVNRFQIFRQQNEN